ncbi:Metallo-dependent hydrolase [Aspergillus japonicus CBS 114.51]|uniref:Metallo-dependent hydrolase n=2 Tax=Aspergillus TaxID=5052 RepID=A0A2V5HKR0_ASPV1|nr:Metallo-dependent hydrolase [Aspergillus japonicus CBS 114.51]PYI24341.1 Metallo-dependent hydrolase [Aspergillus violaceofuscus CBS 115571]RAH82852.1 Metallo-dependent hydrolase [Aspergillus japonicus CBS 114.51]
MGSPMYTLYVGTFIQLPRTTAPDEKHELAITRGALWVSAADGKIKGFDWSIATESDLHTLLKRHGWVLEGAGTRTSVRVKLVRAREEHNEFFFPGFIDTHIHAPQYPNTGLFGSATLLDWLQTYTFPMEASFASPASLPSLPPPTAYRAYSQVIARTLSHGTTTASYYATIHVPATNLLASLAHQRGQRALIGRVCMDNPATCPTTLIDESPEDSIQNTEAVIAHIHSLAPASSKETLVKPILTPRFAPSCTPAALSGLAALAKQYKPSLHIQTHIAENVNEIALVRQQFPDCKDYASVYDTAGLLTPRTILAHAVHFSAAERSLVASRGAKVSHCPASNSALGSGICPVRWLRRGGVVVGLGSDVSGGYSVGLLEGVRQACLVSRLVGFLHPVDEEKGADGVVSVEEALYLATRGGAAVVDLPDLIGGFELGMAWDAQLIRLGRFTPAGLWGSAGAEGNVDVFGTESWTEKVHKWVWSGDDRNVRAVWVQGRLVHGADGGDVKGRWGRWTWVWGLVGVGAAWVVVRRVHG